jgi:hypothetical protein
MFPIHGLMIAHAHRVERERLRRREEEEVMAGYTPEDLSGNWQFKIVRGTFKNTRQIELVQQEQAEFGWVLVEIFDQNRIRFKRSLSEASKDGFREGNPYSTVSKASGPGCATVMIAAIAVAGTFYWAFA